MGKWSELPVNLLQIMEDCLILYADKVRIRAVCVSWNSHLPRMPNHKERQFSWLLQALDNNIEASHSLFNPIDNKSYLLDFPDAQGKVFKGSSYGWVATVEDTHSGSPTEIYLINPLTRARIKLPSRNKFSDVKKYRANKVDKEYSIFAFEEGDHEAFDFRSSNEVNISHTYKVVMSTPPSSDNCLIVAIYGPHMRLAYCKLNDKRWKPLPIKDHRGKTELYFDDIIFHKGKLHALLSSGQVFVFEHIGAGPSQNVTGIAIDLKRRQACTRHLVECSDGGLIMVERCFQCIPCSEDEPTPVTSCFRVYKLDAFSSSWVEVKTIGGDVLFLGLNASLSISSLPFSGYKGNHIYFTDTYHRFFSKNAKQEDADIGIFNLEDKTLQSIPGLKCNSKLLWPSPIWINMG
ncbi:hypothetical protein LguiA_013996 [Lonicera macranthoides]